MSFDPNFKKGQYVDEFGLMLGQNRPWDPKGDNGKGDCIGTTADAYRAYHEGMFIEGILECFPYVKEGDYVQAYRHPSLIGVVPNTMSRDHVAYALYILKYSGRYEELLILAEYLRWKISDKYSFSLDLWLYKSAVTDNPINRFLYYCLTIPYMGACISIKNLVFRLFNVRPEVSQEAWMRKYTQRLEFPKRKSWAKKIISFAASLLPVYTIYQTSFMIDVLPPTLGRKLLRKVLLAGTDRQNLVIRMMLGDRDISSEDVYKYQPMMGGRWTTALNELCDRDIYVITDPDILNPTPPNTPDRSNKNCVDVDLVRGIFFDKMVMKS